MRYTCCKKACNFKVLRSIEKRKAFRVQFYEQHFTKRAEIVNYWIDNATVDGGSSRRVRRTFHVGFLTMSYAIVRLLTFPVSR